MDLEQILDRVSAGDERSFNILYDETSGKIFAIALMMLRNKALAEEAVQETYLKIWRSATQYSAAKGSPMAWLTTIVRRQAIDKIRSLNRQDKIEEALGEEAELVADAMARRHDDVNDQIWFCLGELAPEKAKLILMAFFSGYTHEELSTNTRIPLGTVKSSIRRGLTSLKICMDT